MKMLLIHCDYFSYTTTKPTKFAEEMADECKSCGIKDALVIFVTVEKEDIVDNEKLINKSAEEIIAKAKEVGAKALVLYPFVHLSEKIGPPDVAAKIVDELNKKLMTSGYRVNKAPFGWEKVFSLTSKGHPLAESFKTIKI